MYLNICVEIGGLLDCVIDILSIDTSICNRKFINVMQCPPFQLKLVLNHPRKASVKAMDMLSLQYSENVAVEVLLQYCKYKHIQILNT